MGFKHALLLALLLSLFTSCKTQPAVTPFSSPLITPQAGKSAITGRVISQATGKAAGNTAVRLANVVRQGNEGAFVLDAAASPGTITDEQGHFRFENVEPQEYVIVVGDLYGSYKIVSEPSGQARVWKVEKDQVLDVGELSVDLQP